MLSCTSLGVVLRFRELYDTPRVFFLVLIYSLVVSINTQVVFTNTPDSAYLHPIWVLFYASKSAFAPLLVLFGTSRVLSNTVTFVIQYTYKTKIKIVQESRKHITSYSSNFVVINHLQNSHIYQCIVLPIQIMHTNSTSTSACPRIHSSRN